ncbi:MAG TPA: M23 family metallopeptidase [Pyrinomonadaceae bacterium]|jgi:murein DD-endopeptidase MepM/ murein hydrolase activator NlpD
MKWFGQIIKRIFLVIYLLALHAFAGFFIYEKFIVGYIYPDNSSLADVKVKTEETPVPSPLPVPSIVDVNVNAVDNANINTETNINTNANQISNQNSAASPAPAGALMIPVAGIRREQLTDTFAASRSGGRVHDAIDIMAPAGTPVIAAADGEIAKFFDSKLGGITIYQYSADKKYVYYYAHLQKRADNLREKDFVKQGTVIGYVGDTGNSGAGNYHLHFSISIPNDPARYFEGNYINPFPLLRNGIEARLN